MFVPFISLLENGENFRVWWFWRTQKTIKLTFKRNRRMSPTRFIEERTVFIATFGVLMRKCTSSKGIQFSIFTSYGPLLSRSFQWIVYSCALKFILPRKSLVHFGCTHEFENCAKGTIVHFWVVRVLCSKWKRITVHCDAKVALGWIQLWLDLKRWKSLKTIFLLTVKTKQTKSKKFILSEATRNSSSSLLDMYVKKH